MEPGRQDLRDEPCRQDVPALPMSTDPVSTANIYDSIPLCYRALCPSKVKPGPRIGRGLTRRWCRWSGRSAAVCTLRSACVRACVWRTSPCLEIRSYSHWKHNPSQSRPANQTRSFSGTTPPSVERNTKSASLSPPATQPRPPPWSSEQPARPKPSLIRRPLAAREVTDPGYSRPQGWALGCRLPLSFVEALCHCLYPC